MRPTPWDARMKGFRQRAEVADVEKLLLERIKPLNSECVDIANSAGRVLAQPIASTRDVPNFDRAAMDGYALKGEETFGATEYAPIRLKVVGESLAGRASDRAVNSGEAIRIMTGAPMPGGADAVLMAEDATESGDCVDVTAAVPPLKNVSRRGEDIRSGETLFEAGRLLRPQDVGVLISIGVAQVSVCRRARVDIFATGNELVPAGSNRGEFQIADANSPMLLALVERDGGIVERREIIKDDAESIRAALSASKADVILVTGGSSVGKEDFVPQIVAELGELPIHGIAMRPSSPAGVGFIGGRPVFLLPGNPVSCLCAYDFFAGPTIRALAGRPRAWPYRTISAPLAKKITSESGRVDYARVKIVDGKVEPLMVSGASILSSTTRADGFVIVARDDEGIAEGAVVTVYLYG